MKNDFKDVFQTDEEVSAKLLSLTPGGMHRCYLGNPIHLEYASDGLCKLAGYTREEFQEVIGKKHMYANIIHPDDWRKFALFCKELAHEAKIQTIEYRIIRKDGKILNVSDTMESVRNEDGIMRGYSAVTDITQLKEKQLELEQQKLQYEEMYKRVQLYNKRFNIVSNLTGIAFYEYDLISDEVVSVNNFEMLTGYESSEVLKEVEGLIRGMQKVSGMESNFVHPEDVKQLERAQKELIENGESHCEIRIRQKDGNYLWCIKNCTVINDDYGVPERVICCILNNQREHKQIDELKMQLSKEPMTHLYNKESAFKIIEGILHECPQRKHALLMFDLDNFKQVNDHLGHKMGDELIISFSEKMRSIFGENDILARYGGDEFLAFLSDITSEGTVHQKAKQLIISLQNEMVFSQVGVNISVSIGIAFSNNQSDVQQLVINADKALYDAKNKGKCCISVYDGEGIVAPSYQQLALVEQSMNGGVGIFKIGQERLEAIYISPSLPNLVGYEDKADYVKNAWDFIYKGDMKRIQKAIEACVESEKKIDMMFRLQHVNGTIIWVQAVINVLGYEDNCPMVHIVFNNISKHIAIYNELLDSSDRSIHLSDSTTYEILYANVAAAKGAGREIGSYLGCKCYEWYANKTAPCEGCLVEKTRKEGYSKFTVEKQYNGRYYEITGKALDWQGRGVFAEYVTDITDKKERCLSCKSIDPKLY